MRENPFDRPPIVIEKMTLKELHDMLRERINTHYMPTAAGKRQFNSKPTYLRHVEPDSSGLWHCGATYSTYADFYTSEDGGEIIVALPIDDLAVVVGLTSLKTCVYVYKDLPEPWEFGEEWTNEKTLALNRIELAKQLDMLG